MQDPDLEIREGVIQTLEGGREVPKKSAFQASVSSKNKGGAGPFPGSATVITENNSGPIWFF